MGSNNVNFDDTRVRYLELGLEVIPLKPNTKLPMRKGYLIKDHYEQWFGIDGLYNIGLRLGKVVDIENDDEAYGIFLDKILSDFGIKDFPKYKSKRGVHRLFYLDNKPHNLKTMNLIYPDSPNPDVHYGELRVHGQSVMPYSIIDEFLYEWIDDSDRFLDKIPHLSWSKLKYLTMYSNKRQEDQVYVPKMIVKPAIPESFWLDERLRILESAPKGCPVTFDKKTYPSRSEAEAAVLTFLISYGWTFKDVYDSFEKEKPGHFASKKEKGKDYLQKLYNKIYYSGYRKSILREMSYLKTSFQRDRVYHVLLSLAFQFNTNRVNRSYELLANDLWIINKNSKNGPRKACLKLEKEGKIQIVPGKRYNEKSKRRATEFILNEVRE